MADARPESKFVTINGLKIHYLDWGNASAPPLLMLHGMGSLAHVYDHLSAGLADKFHVLAPDQRGHGESDASTEYTEKAYTSDLDQFVEKLGLDRFAILGMSMGARFASDYGLRQPKKVTKVVCIEGPSWEEKETIAYGERLKSMQDFAVPSREAMFDKFMSMNPRFNKDVLNNFLQYNLKPTEDGKFTWTYDRALRGPAGIAFIDEIKSHRYDAWKELQTPTLLVRGENSPGTTREIADTYAAQAPNARAVHIPNAGVTVHIEQPDELLRVIREFLTQ